MRNPDKNDYEALARLVQTVDGQRMAKWLRDSLALEQDAMLSMSNDTMLRQAVGRCQTLRTVLATLETAADAARTWETS